VRHSALALLAAFVRAGCGGGSGRLSRADLANRATKIGTDQAATIAQIPRGPANATNATGYLGAVLSVVEKGVKQFHRLEPPGEQEATYRAFLGELDRNVDILRTLRAAAAANQRRDYVAGLAGPPSLASPDRPARATTRIHGVRGLELCVGAGAPATFEQSILSCVTAATTSRKARNDGLRVPFV